MKKSETVSGDEDTVLRPYRYCNPLVVPGCSVDKKEDELDKQSEQVKKTNSGSEKVTKWSKNEELSNVSENEELDNTSQNKDLFESLPIEMVWKVAEYLSVQDLSACCGVSRLWRHIFGDDLFWQKHCDPSLEEYLRTTPCEVEPVFVSPEGEGSTLSPVGRWRMAFFRECHLYNNWEMHKYKTSEKVDIYNLEKEFNIFESYGFLGNDHVIVTYENGRVALWRLSVDMEIRSALKCLPNTQYKAVNVSLGLLINLSRVQVITLNEAANDVAVKHLFFFDDSQKVLENYLSLFKDVYRLKNANVLFDNKTFAVVGTVFIGALPKMSSSLHVWDLERGIKLTEEKCPLAVTCTLVKVFQSQSSEYAAVAYESYENGDFHAHIFVYDAKNLTFLSFKQITHGKIPTIGHAALHKEYIAIYHTEVEATIDVYNVVSSEHVFHCLTGDSLSTVGVIDDSFVFDCHRTATLFNPTSKRRSVIPDSLYIDVIENKILVLSKDYINLLYFWKTKRSSDFKSLPKGEQGSTIFSCDFNLLNAASSRLLVCYNCKVLYSFTFW